MTGNRCGCPRTSTTISRWRCSPSGRKRSWAARPGLITADPGRRAICRREFVEAHFRPGARPAGHGFTEQNRLDGTAHYVYDTPAARFIALDTNCATGGAAGAIDAEQARWLEARLAEVHAAYRGPGGREVRTGHDDRLVVLFSHHGIDTIISAGRTAARAAAGPLLGTDELLTLVHRFPNVVLWLNGHTHTNAIRPRPDPDHPARGFWEVTTCAIVDWPCQARLIELIDAGGHLSIVCTMVDHDSPVAPRSLETVDDLASLHRELAANVPYGGADLGAFRCGQRPQCGAADRSALPAGPGGCRISHDRRAAVTTCASWPRGGPGHPPGRRPAGPGRRRSGPAPTW